jgi:hypothetical protein
MLGGCNACRSGTAVKSTECHHWRAPSPQRSQIAARYSFSGTPLHAGSSSLLGPSLKAETEARIQARASMGMRFHSPSAVSTAASPVMRIMARPRPAANFLIMARLIGWGNERQTFMASISCRFIVCLGVCNGICRPNYRIILHVAAE